MRDALEAAFVEEVGVSPLEASILASLVRSDLAPTAEASEESPEDLVLRMRDPRVFGTFAASVLSEDRATSAGKILLAEHAFDLLSLPRGEVDVILVESRAPPRLLDLGAFLAAEDRLTILHVMHLVYAVFLDRSLVMNVDRRTRSRVLMAVVGHAETPESIRAFYACLHLAAVPEPEGHATLRKVLRSRAPDPLKFLLATIAASDDAGVRVLFEIATQEGLLPSGLEESASVAANIPRMPERLAALGRRHLRA